MPGQLNFGWYPEGKEWKPLRVDADGSIHVVGYVDLLSDIGNVIVAGIADGMGIYWDAGTPAWKVKQFLPLAGGTLTGTLTMGAGQKIVIPLDGLLEFIAHTVNCKLFGGPTVAIAGGLVLQPMSGNKPGSLSILPSGAEHTASLGCCNASDIANIGFIELAIIGTDAHLYAGKLGTGDIPTFLDSTLPFLPATDKNIALGSLAKRWLDIFALHRNTQSVLGTDHTFAGDVTTDITAGENLAFGDAVYMRPDGKAWKADADAAAFMPVFGIAVAAIAAEATGEILTSGWIRDDSWALTAGGIVYASVTPGAISTTAPIGTGDQVQVIGIAKTTHIIHFNPSYELVEIS